MVTSFEPVLNLSDLDGSNGFVIRGIDANDFSGNLVNSAGDINGDGIDDITIGAISESSASFPGESYVIFGRSGGFDSTLDLASLDGSNGFTIPGLGNFDVAGLPDRAGDLNGDGIDDLIIGAPNAAANGTEAAGSSYVIFGRSGGFDSSFDLASLDGSNGFVINGDAPGGFLGNSVGGAGDLNGDGIDDIVIGAPGIGPRPPGVEATDKSYVVFGRSGGFDSSLDISSLDGSNGFTITGVEVDFVSASVVDGFSANSISGAGDVNGDGINDLVIGVPDATSEDGSLRVGKSYVVFGSSSAAPTLDVSSLDGTNGFVIDGLDAGDRFGFANSAGDVNGDGIDDLVISAPGSDPNGTDGAGQSYVVFGRSDGFGSSFDLASLDGSNGFLINGIDAGDSLGSASSAGDLNGDGIDDLIIGAAGADPSDAEGAGESYIIFGRVGGFDSSFDLTSLDGSNGFVISGIDAGDLSGDSVSGAGDVNGDGIADVIIGAANANGQAGESYVVFGRRAIPPVLVGTSGADVIVGGNDDEVIRGRGGSDQLHGGGGADVISGGRGADWLRGGTGADALKGGAGADRLIGGAQNDTLLGGGGSDSLLGGLGRDVLTGGGGSDVLQGDAGNDILSGNGGRDIFVLQAVSGLDTIQDYRDGLDRLGLSTGLTFQNLDIVQRGRDTLIRTSSGAVALLLNVDATTLTARDFV